MKNKGTIALDIDGTITDASHMIPRDVLDYFEALYKDNWQFVFLTGRPFSFAEKTLSSLTFPYFLAVQNGANCLLMPERKMVEFSYFSFEIIQLIDEIYQGEKEDFLIYSGYDNKDFCYYRKERFSKKMLMHFDLLKKTSGAPWKEVKSLDEIDQREFPLIKCVGYKKPLLALYEKIKEIKGVEVKFIRDAMNSDFHLIMVTDKEANKGHAIDKLMNQFDLAHPLITGGNDYNDIPLLKRGDVKIAMEDGPIELKTLADIIAPSSTLSGIIPALKEAIL